jgi:hypothetical protein
MFRPTMRRLSFSLPTRSLSDRKLLIGSAAMTVLFVSSLPAVAQVVPDVTNQPNSAAYQTLRTAGFDAVQVYEKSPTVSACKVIRTDPAANTNAQPGTRVTMHVSSGLPTSNVAYGCPPVPTLETPPTVPDVTGQTNQMAYRSLRNFGFEGWQRLEPSTTVGACKVIRTDPAANTNAPPGTRVTMHVSSGPQSAAAHYGCPPVPNNLPTQPPNVTSFTASPDNGYIPVGGTATLNWQVAECGPDCTVSLEGKEGLGNTVLHMVTVSPIGSQQVTPHFNTFYTLRALSPAGTSAKEKEVKLHGPSQAGMSYYFKLTNPTSVVTPCFTVAVWASTADEAKRIAEQANGGYMATQIDVSQFLTACN